MFVVGTGLGHHRHEAAAQVVLTVLGNAVQEASLHPRIGAVVLLGSWRR